MYDKMFEAEHMYGNFRNVSIYASHFIILP